MAIPFRGKSAKYYTFMVLDCIGIIGNILIAWFFLKVHFKAIHKMSSYHFLLLQLAVLDLLICIAVTIMENIHPGIQFLKDLFKDLCRLDDQNLQFSNNVRVTIDIFLAISKYSPPFYTEIE